MTDLDQTIDHCISLDQLMNGKSSLTRQGSGVNTIRFSVPLELKFKNYMPDYLHELSCGGIPIVIPDRSLPIRWGCPQRLIN